MTAYYEHPVGGRYQVISKIGQGGFGETYLAEDTYLHGKKCVIKKFIYTSNDTQDLAKAKELFKREAKVLARLGKHSQIPQLLASFEEDNDFYLVQEWIDGETLSSELKRKGKLNEEEIKQFLQEILELLQYVHNNRVIHRDIKPDNIMRRRQDDKLVLIDFGCVKQFITANRQLNQPHNPTRIGTEGYAPNEQLSGNTQFSSDIYSVGMTSVFALTAIQPKDLQRNYNTNELLWQDKALDISYNLVRIVNKMIEENSHYRYLTIQDILTDLSSSTTSQTIPVNSPTLIPDYPRSTIKPTWNIPLKPSLIILVPIFILVGFAAGFSLVKNQTIPVSQPPSESPGADSPSLRSEDFLKAPNAPSQPETKPEPVPENSSEPSGQFLCPDSLKGKIPSCS